MPTPLTLLRDAVLILNGLAALGLAIYALNQAVLLALRLRRRSGGGPPPAAAADLPDVTVQVPLFNERYVAPRIIAALCALDYPPDRLHIQVLDDSTDDTARIAQRAVEAARDRGTDIQFVHRDHRQGYKAGALGNGLRGVASDYVAVFDADFIPPPDFLRAIFQTRRPFDDPAVGFAQTRWGFLNREATALTRGQALLLDMHFHIDQPARSSAGLPMNFNGSGGVWRRACIEDAGGWQTDTLTEDLDLSYRAEIRGWRGVYLADQESPGELPESVAAYKRQQARWARGTAQCIRKLFPPMARSGLPLHKRLAGGLHLSGYMTCPLVLWLALTTPYLAMETRGTLAMPGWMSALGLIGLLPMVSMFVAHTLQARRPARFLRDLPVAVMFSVGLSLSNTAAVLAGLLAKGSGVFIRTPKRAQPGRPPADAYVLKPDWTMWGEMALAVYALAVCALLLRAGHWADVPPVLLYGLCFAVVALCELIPWLAGMTRGGGTPRTAVGSQVTPGR